MAAAPTGARGKATVADSAQYLASQASDLTTWDGIEHLAQAAYDPAAPVAAAKAAAHHIQVVRNELARQLWSRQLFVGVTLLDELLLHTAAAGEPDPILGTLEYLRDSERGRGGLLVLPLHSFGFLAAGLLRPLGGASTALINAPNRFALTPQTNSLEHTIVFLRDVGPPLGVRKLVDPDLIRHWRRSRGTAWLERNPLLVAGVTSTAGYYYENEFLLLGRLRALTAAIVMLATLQPRTEDRAGFLFSSSQLNNLETRDIRHYLVLTADRRRLLTGQAVPIHRRWHVDELSDLAVDIDPRYWSRKAADADEIYRAVDSLYGGYLQHTVGACRENSLGRTYRKLFEAVSYFRRSYQSGGRGYTAVLSLATAFEMLLTDSYASGTAVRLRRRTQRLLRGVPGTRRYQQSVEDLYYARNRTIHAGTDEHLDLHDARQAFVLAFVALMGRMPTLTGQEDCPLGTLTGDL